MKKIIFSILLVSLLLVSCASIGTGNKVSKLSNMGKEGDIIITSRPEFLDLDYKNKIDRINIAYSNEEISGCVEGNFSKILGSIALKYIDLNNLELDYYQPKKGLMVFSSLDAKSYSLEIEQSSDYIDELDMSRILDADFAVYSKHPLSEYQNIDRMLFLVKNEICCAEFKASDASKAKGLFTAIKSSYVSYLNKNMISVDFKELSNDFTLLDDTIYIENLPYEGFIQSFVEEFLYYGR